MTPFQRDTITTELDGCARQLRHARRALCLGVPEAADLALRAACIQIERVRHALDNEAACAALCAELEDECNALIAP